MTFWLEMQDGENRRVLEVARSEFTIGRGADNDAVLGDPRSSRRHCRIQKTPQGLLLEDLESRNGTLLNGFAVKKSFIKAGDEFRVGEARFKVHEGESVPAVEQSPPASPAGASSPAEELSHTPPQGPAPRNEELLEDPEEASGGEDRGPVEEAEPWTLEGLKGPHSGTKVVVGTTPFVLGRGKDCDLRIRDQRASSRHARILFDGTTYSVEDLGSTNGTLLNRQPVEQAALSPGDVLQIGNSSFRVHGPVPTASGVGGRPEAEEFVEFDAEKFLSARRAEHPVTIVGAILIIGVLGYFAVDVTQRLVRRQEVDPSSPENLMGEHWSFEVESGEGADGRGEVGASASVPGWTLRCWTPEGTSAGPDVHGSMSTIPRGAQPPGLRALRLVAEGNDVAALASRRVTLGVRGGEPYRLEGHVVHDGCFAAGLLVEWLRESGGEAVVLERVFSEAARSAGERLDVDLPVKAPAGATQAAVSCVVLGGGAGLFDRIVFERQTADDPGDRPPEPIAVDRSSPVRFDLEGGPTDARLLGLVAEPDGTLSVERSQKQKLIPALWAGHGPERDHCAVGPRLAASRVMSRERNSLLRVGEVPDQEAGDWTTIETKVTAKRGDVLVRWRTSGSEPSGSEPGLAILIELPKGVTPVEFHGGGDAGEPSSPGRATESVVEIVVGSRGERVSLQFSAPLELTQEPHPLDAARVLLVGRTHRPSLEVSLTRGSRHEALAARRHFRSAEEAYRAGRVADAMKALERMPALYPAQEAEIERARERLSEWQRQAAEETTSVADEIQELERVPNPVLYDLAVRRARQLAERYRETSHGEEAARLLESVQSFWKERKERREAELLQSLYERGKSHFARNELPQATTYLRWVAEDDSDGDLGSQARATLELIEERRKTEQNLFLRR